MGRTLQIICGCVLALGMMGASPQGYSTGEQPQAKQEASAANDPATAEQGDGGDQLYAACRPGEDNRESDLCAQWKAADSAAEAAVWTRRTGRFTGWGLAIGFVTMAAAIAAAVFAALASKHTRRGANIAEQQLSAAVTPILRVEIRGAIVENDRMNQIAAGEPARFVPLRTQIAIRNLSPSLAIVDQMRAWSVDVGGEGGLGNALPDIDVPDYPLVIEPGQSVIIPPLDPRDGQSDLGFFHLRADNREYWFHNPPVVVGEVAYRDVLGNRREMAFAYRPAQIWANNWAKWGGNARNYDRSVKA